MCIRDRCLGKLLFSKLSEFPEILNLRNCGLIFGFDLKSNKFRDIIVGELYTKGLICNKTGSNSIRLRPSLNLTEQNIEQAVAIFEKSFAKKRKVK